MDGTAGGAGILDSAALEIGLQKGAKRQGPIRLPEGLNILPQDGLCLSKLSE